MWTHTFRKRKTIKCRVPTPAFQCVLITNSVTLRRSICIKIGIVELGWGRKKKISIEVLIVLFELYILLFIYSF